MTISFNAEGGEYTFEVITNQPQWDVLPSDSWVLVSKSSTSFTVSVSENTAAERLASIQVSAGDATPVVIPVKQTATHHSLMVKNLPTQPNTFGRVDIVLGNTTGNPAGTAVTIRATPANGYAFAGWVQDVSSTTLLSAENPYTFSIEENTLLYAIFIADQENNVTEIYSTWELGQIGSGGPGTKMWGLERKYILKADLELSEWMPIGNGTSKDNDARFTGVFDGNLHTLTIKSIAKEILPLQGTVSDNNYYEIRYVGIFGVIGTYGVVENLTVKGEITGKYAPNRNDKQMIGSIAGSLEGGYIENCFSEMNMEIGGGDLSLSYIGGFAGNSEAGSIISGCHSKGNIVSAYRSDRSTGGGIVGNNLGTVQYCSSSGNVSISQSFAASSGGIAGINQGVIHTSCTKGDISAFNSARSSSGGISGNSYGDINNSYSLCNVKTYGTMFTSGSFTLSGGIVGSGQDDSITNTYATGNISAADGSKMIYSYPDGLVEVFNNHAGGIAGSSKQVRNSVALNSEILISKGNYIGRIVGYEWGKMSNNQSIIIPGLPDGTLDDKNGKTIVGISQETFSDAGWRFGYTTDNPWRWDNAEQRPKLFWE
jgi:hypothetical protein